MRISFMTFACPEWTADEVIAGAVRHGYDGIEWRVGAGHAHGVEFTLPNADRVALRRRLEASGLASACLATSLRFVTSESVAETAPLLELATALGAPGLRVFCGPLPEDMTLAEAVPRVAEHLRSVADAAQAHGVGLWLETHDSMNRAAPVAAVLKLAAHPALAANWDTMHPYFNGETFEETQRLLHGSIAHTHFHDALSGDPATITPFGTGHLPCAEMLAYLQQEEFTGYLSGEWFNDRMGATPDDALAIFIRGLKDLMGENK